MRRQAQLRHCCLLGTTPLLVGLLCLSLAPASAESGADEYETNRPVYEKLRSDPRQLARLRREQRAFLSLPADKQKRLRQLHRELQDEDSTMQAHLQRVMRRYVEWLDHLPAPERKRIEEAANSTERLRIIQQLREGEWIARLPKALRDRIEQASAEQRPALIARIRRDEEQRQLEWAVAIKSWDELTRNVPQPSRLTEYAPEVQDYVSRVLLPQLTHEEKDRLMLAEGSWPLYPRTLVELADRHIQQLPGPAKGPTRFAELPADVREKLGRIKSFPPYVVNAEGRWPNYAFSITRLARQRKIDIAPLGPSRPEELPPAVQSFLTTQLLPRLDEKELAELQNTERKWPEYPRTLRDLAHKHDLDVPGETLPGPRKLWDRFRPKPRFSTDGSPEVPDHVLLDFARKLSAKELEQMRISFTDPASKERLKKEWIKRNPEEWERIQQADYQKRLRKMKLGSEG